MLTLATYNVRGLWLAADSYTKRKGHRQDHTVLRITGVAADLS